MREKPKIIIYMASAILLVPVVASLLVYAGTHFQKQFMDRGLVQDFILLCVGAVIVSYGVWKVRSWGFYLLLGFGLAVIGMDLQQIITTPSTLNVWHFVDGLLVFVGFGIILQERIRAPYFNPKIRWWERASRHKTDIQGAVEYQGQDKKSLILDISATGCFIDVDLSAQVGSVVDVKINFGGVQFTSKAKFVRHSNNPRGVGLMYIDTDKDNKKAIKQILEQIVKNPSENA